MKNFAMMLAVLFAFSSCASMKMGKKSVDQYLGEWEYEIEEIPADIDGTFVLSREEGVLKGTMITPMGDVSTLDITLVENALTASFDAGGTILDLEGTFEGDAYAGRFFVQDTDFPMKMTRKE